MIILMTVIPLKGAIHPRRQNMTTSMVGLKTFTYAKISRKMMNPRDKAGERRQRRRKGAIPDCLQSPHCAANCLQHILSSGRGAIQSCAYHMQCISHATCCRPSPLACHQLSALFGRQADIGPSSSHCRVWTVSRHRTHIGPMSKSCSPIAVDLETTVIMLESSAACPT